MAKKATSQAGKSQKAVSQNEKKTEEDLMLEVSNESEQVDETSSECYCPFDLLEGDETEAIYASFSQKELKEIIKKDEEELGPLPEAILGVDSRSRIQAPFKYPYTAICSLKIAAKDGNKFIGTGFFVGPRVVVTAGHCVYMHDHGGWAQNIEVIPALDGTSKPYGSAVSYCFHSLKGWTNKKDSGYDYGVIILPENAALGQKTGWFGYGYKTDDSYFKNRAITLSGYPGDKGGSQQWGMSGAATGVTNGGRKFAYQIDTYGGQSGSPVWVYENNGYYVRGIHTTGSSNSNYATRINKNIFEKIKDLKAKYPAK